MNLNINKNIVLRGVIIIKKYKIVSKTTEVKQLEKCTCDRCGAVVNIDKNWQSTKNHYSDIEIWNHFISNDLTFSHLQYQLCPKCVLELLDFFKMVDEEKMTETKEDVLLRISSIPKLK